MEQNKKIIIGIVVVTVILTGGYLGYKYYPKQKKITETVKDKIIEKELSKEDILKNIPQGQEPTFPEKKEILENLSGDSERTHKAQQDPGVSRQREEMLKLLKK